MDAIRKAIAATELAILHKESQLHHLRLRHLPTTVATVPPPARLAQMAPPSAAVLHGVAQRLGRARASLRAGFRARFVHAAIARARWKGSLPQHRASKLRSRRPGRPVLRRTLWACFEAACSTPRVGVVGAMRAARAYEGGVCDMAPHAARNVAHVPEWDERVAASRCPLLTCGPRLPDALMDVCAHAVVNPWTRGERLLFLRAFVRVGRDFATIAAQLQHKGVHDVVRFYYKHKLDYDLQGLLDHVEQSGKSITEVQLTALAEMPDLGIGLSSAIASP